MKKLSLLFLVAGSVSASAPALPKQEVRDYIKSLISGGPVQLEGYPISSAVLNSADYSPKAAELRYQQLHPTFTQIDRIKLVEAFMQMQQFFSDANINNPIGLENRNFYRNNYHLMNAAARYLDKDIQPLINAVYGEEAQQRYKLEQQQRHEEQEIESTLRAIEKAKQAMADEINTLQKEITTAENDFAKAKQNFSKKFCSEDPETSPRNIGTRNFFVPLIAEKQKALAIKEAELQALLTNK